MTSADKIFFGTGLTILALCFGYFAALSLYPAPWPATIAVAISTVTMAINLTVCWKAR